MWWKWFTDPALFNYLILALQVAAAVRWTLAGNWNQALYWWSAVGVVWAVTNIGR